MLTCPHCHKQFAPRPDGSLPNHGRGPLGEFLCPGSPDAPKWAYQPPPGVPASGKDGK